LLHSFGFGLLTITQLIRADLKLSEDDQHAFTPPKLIAHLVQGRRQYFSKSRAEPYSYKFFVQILCKFQCFSIENVCHVWGPSPSLNPTRGSAPDPVGLPNAGLEISISFLLTSFVMVSSLIKALCRHFKVLTMAQAQKLMESTRQKWYVVLPDGFQTPPIPSTLHTHVHAYIRAWTHASLLVQTLTVWEPN
jgi:hypothetical protein